RMPASELRPPAWLTTLLSEALRVAGPPNSAWSAWPLVSVSCGRGWPGVGGTSAKSGGITSGALRDTANSSGALRLFSPRLLPQPASVMAARPRPAKITVLRIQCLRYFRLFWGIAHQQRPNEQDQYADGNSSIGKVENQK